MARIPQEKLVRQALLITPIGKQPRGQSGTRWHDYIFYLGWSHFSVELTELSEVAENCKVFWDVPSLWADRAAAPATLLRVNSSWKMNVLKCFWCHKYVSRHYSGMIFTSCWKTTNVTCNIALFMLGAYHHVSCKILIHKLETDSYYQDWYLIVFSTDHA